MPLRLLGPALIMFLCSAACGAGQPASKPADRDAVLAKLKAKQVNTLSLTLPPKAGPATINLGLGLDGGETDNACDETLGLATQLPEVEAIQLWKGKFSPEALTGLAGLPRLKSLDIWQSDIEPKAFAVLGKLRTLEFLRIQEYPVTDELLGYLGESPPIKFLDIGKATARVTGAGFSKFLTGAKNLEGLFVFGNFPDDGCLKLIGQKTGMKTLLMDSRTITAEGWKSLSGLTKLERLDAPGTSFDDAGMKALAGMKGLKYLSLNDTRITDEGMASLEGLNELTDLGLEGTRITDTGMIYLKHMTGLRNLYVGRTEVTAKGLAFVPEKDKMVMLRSGREALPPKQFDELITMFPGTQIFDPDGYWTDDRIKAAMKMLGKEWPPTK